MAETLKPFQRVISELSERYGIPFEIVEQIIIDWANTLYLTMTGREPNNDGLF